MLNHINHFPQTPPPILERWTKFLMKLQHLKTEGNSCYQVEPLPYRWTKSHRNSIETIIFIIIPILISGSSVEKKVILFIVYTFSVPWDLLINLLCLVYYFKFRFCGTVCISYKKILGGAEITEGWSQRLDWMAKIKPSP